MSKRIALILVVVLLLSACGPAAPGPTPTPTKTATPPATAEQPTAAPIDTVAAATDTPAPSAQPTDTPAATLETPTLTEQPTDTPAPAPTNTAAPRPVASGQMASPDYGAQAFLWWREDVADRDLTLMRNAGFRWVKQWFAWNDIEGAGRGQYDWSIPDRIVQQAEDHGLNLLVRVDREPAWAGPPPQNNAAFQEFLAGIATRYRGRIDAIQIWNEPNLAREWGNKAPNAAEYAQMLRDSYRTIKAIDPNMVVVTAGMAPTGTCCDIAKPDDQFYREMYAAMGGNSDGYFDMLGGPRRGLCGAARGLARRDGRQRGAVRR
jgi:hypothetical protein